MQSAIDRVDEVVVAAEWQAVAANLQRVLPVSPAVVEAADRASITAMAQFLRMKLYEKIAADIDATTTNVAESPIEKEYALAFALGKQYDLPLEVKGANVAEYLANLQSYPATNGGSNPFTDMFLARRLANTLGLRITVRNPVNDKVKFTFGAEGSAEIKIYHDVAGVHYSVHKDPSSTSGVKNNCFFEAVLQAYQNHLGGQAELQESLSRAEEQFRSLTVEDLRRIFDGFATDYDSSSAAGDTEDYSDSDELSEDSADTVSSAFSEASSGSDLSEDITYYERLIRKQAELFKDTSARVEESFNARDYITSKGYAAGGSGTAKQIEDDFYFAMSLAAEDERSCGFFDTMDSRDDASIVPQRSNL